MPTCVHIVKNAQPECTGIARVVADLAKHSSMHGYQSSILFLGDGPLVKSTQDAGIPAAAVQWSGRRNDLAGARRVWRWMRAHPANVAHLHRGAGALRLLCRLAGAKAVVQHVHGPALEPHLHSVSNLTFRGADAVVACSQSVADLLRGCAPEVIYAGIDLPADLPPPPPLSGPLRLGLLSRLVPLKNIESVIDATARLVQMGINVQTEIAGTGPSESALRERAAESSAADRIHFLSWQQNPAALLASWHILLMPSTHEGFPVAALEAMRAARPVFASHVGGLPELVADGRTGRLFTPGDTEALIRSIAEADQDRTQLARMGREGWERARSMFSVQEAARRTTALYDRLLNRTPGGAA
jgi:glycosyltransferase involved in cell wall biosynthesis